MNHHAFYHYSAMQLFMLESRQYVDERRLPDGRSGSMDRLDQRHQDEMYRLPPTDIQSIDDWKEETVQGESESEPEPDYQDLEIEQEDYKELRKRVKPRLTTLLTQDDWTKIVEMAEHDGKGSDIEIPDPDYDDEYLSKPPLVPSQSSPHRSREGLIEPKKLFNPCIESKKVQNVHREMMMNKKLGKDVLHQKSELKQELERRKELQKKKELEEQYKKKRTSFEVKIAEQANKLESVEKQQSKTLPEEDDQQPEFYRVHSKISKSHNQT